VTALFAEYTGTHKPLEVDWSLERGVRTISAQRSAAEPAAAIDEPVAVAAAPPAIARSPAQRQEAATSQASPALPHATTSGAVVVEPRPRAFATFWEFAVALNRSDPAAVALAGDGATSEIPIDAAELRKLLDLMWFRSVLARLSANWRDRILNVLIDGAAVPDHPVKIGRQAMRLGELSYEQLQEIGSKTMVPDWVRPDLDLLITVGRFWGADAVKRVRFVEAPERHEPSVMESLLERFRG
jgi:hypothetical protein